MKVVYLLVHFNTLLNKFVLLIISSINEIIVQLLVFILSVILLQLFRRIRPRKIFRRTNNECNLNLSIKYKLINIHRCSWQWRIQEFLKGGADEKNRAKGGADGTKMQTFRRILLEKSEKSNPKGGAAAPTASPLDPPLPRTIVPFTKLPIRFGE